MMAFFLIRVYYDLSFGEPALQPRMKEVPVRLPYPPAADVSSIFKVQKSGGTKSAFA